MGLYFSVKKWFSPAGLTLPGFFPKTQVPSAQVTLTKQLEQNLQDSRQELATLKAYQREMLESLPLGACLLDASHCVLIWNKAAAAFSGISEVEVLGHPLSQLPPPWSSMLARLIEDDDKQLRNQKLEFPERTKWLNLHKATINHIQNPPVLGMAILMEDVTEQYLLGIELAHSERLAAIGRLAAGVAHEIGNPITAIACLAQNLAAEQAVPEVQTTTQQVLEQTQRIANILQNLIHFSQNTKQGPSIEESINIRQTVEQAIHLIRLSPQGKQLYYQNTCDPSLAVWGDSQRLLQVFVHLLDNAKDASLPRQTIFLSTQTHSRHLEITIRDEGHGIPPNQLSRIFDPFFTTKAPGQGCGLGLPLAYSILKEQGGHIYIDSEPNNGTQAIIRLPLPKSSL